MKLKSFNYYRPEKAEEVFKLLEELSPEVKLMAGGTDILVGFRLKGETSPNIISLQHLSKELNYIKEDGQYLKIGSLTTHRELEKSKLIKERYAVLHDAVSQVGSVQIRNIATIGGNLCSSLPSADSAAPLLSLNASVVAASKAGEREIKLEDFFLGPGKNVLGNNEIIKEIIVPAAKPGSSGAYIKHTRREAMELPLTGVAVSIAVDETKTICLDIKIALASSAPVPFRSCAAEEILRGNKIDQNILLKAGGAAVGDADPRTSFRCTEEYRCSVIPVLLERAVTMALDRLDN